MTHLSSGANLLQACIAAATAGLTLYAVLAASRHVTAPLPLDVLPVHTCDAAVLQGTVPLLP